MDSVEDSIAFVLDSKRIQAVGLAFLVAERLALTCAHVINRSLERPLTEAAPVPEGARIPLDFAMLGSSDDWFELSAKVVGWLPRRQPLDLDEDVAVLRLGQDLRIMGALPLRIRSEPDIRRIAKVQMWGPAAGERAGRHVLGRLMGPVGKNRLQVDEYVQGTRRVGRGFSGGPAWYPRSGDVVGMLQAVSSDDDTAEVFVLAGGLLELAVASTTPRRTGLFMIRDHGKVTYDGTAYSWRHLRLVRNDSLTTRASADATVSVDRLHNEDPAVSSAYHRKYPLEADRLGFQAWCTRGNQRKEMNCVPRMPRDARVDFTLYFAEGDELAPGESAEIECSCSVSDRQWGQWYEQHIRGETDRLSAEVWLPTYLEPECWGMTELPSQTGLEPLSNLTTRSSGGMDVYSWDSTATEDDLPQGRRVRLDWFFWRRILDPDDRMDPSDVMAQFGILQIRNPVRGRPLPSHVPTSSRVRSIDVESATGRDLARRILAHLRRVAGWVSRYRNVRPDVGMGIAAPQLGIAYRIAVIKKPHSEQFVELINPRITAESDQLADEHEGCFSFFDVRGIVRRPSKVTVAHDHLDRETTTTVFEGGLARNVQHEIDHLNGKIYTDEDRMPAGKEPVLVEGLRADRGQTR
jgi:peptide deformylase